MDDFILSRADSGEILTKSDQLEELLDFAKWFCSLDYIICYKGKIILTHIKEV